MAGACMEPLCFAIRMVCIWCRYISHKYLADDGAIAKWRTSTGSLATDARDSTCNHTISVSNYNDSCAERSHRARRERASSVESRHTGPRQHERFRRSQWSRPDYARPRQYLRSQSAATAAAIPAVLSIPDADWPDAAARDAATGYHDASQAASVRIGRRESECDRSWRDLDIALD